jgi:hypothetical protein
MKERKCGDCSLCCSLLSIEEIEKPANVWCQHCQPGEGGCSIYADRPLACRTYACQWLINPATMGDEWRPTRAKMVVTYQRRTDGGYFLSVDVDPSVPDRWRQAPYYKKIKRASLLGLTDRKRFITGVTVGNRHWIILPNKDVELHVEDDNIRVIITQIGPKEWHVEDRFRNDGGEVS